MATNLRAARDTFLHYLADNLSLLTIHNLRVKATSGAIQYATTVTSAVGSPAYSLDIRVKQLA